MLIISQVFSLLCRRSVPNNIWQIKFHDSVTAAVVDHALVAMHASYLAHLGVKLSMLASLNTRLCKDTDR